jgi:hypothetical protein
MNYHLILAGQHHCQWLRTMACGNKQKEVKEVDHDYNMEGTTFLATNNY